MNKGTCHSSYWNLIEMLENKNSVQACTLIREIWNTSNCDSISNFKSHRDKISSYIGSPVVERILNYKTSDEDRERAQDVIIHYRNDIRKQLVSSLLWNDRLYYKILYQVFPNRK